MAKCFEPLDTLIYDELQEVNPVSIATVKGDPRVVRDVFGFYMKKAESVNENMAFVYRMRQVEANKKTGTGEDIYAGDRLYYIVADNKVSPAHGAGTPGTDYYFCGWAKFDASANETTVIMNFDGTRYNENL